MSAPVTAPAPAPVTAPALILASASAARRAMLTAADIPHAAESPGVDEAALKAEMADQTPPEVARRLAEAKALAVSARRPGALVLGSDQTLDLDGTVLDKVADLDAARDRLLDMRGRSHRLHSGAALARDGQVIWSTVETATVTLRDVSDAWLETYLATEGPTALASVAVYRLEGPGAQMMSRVDGDHFTVLGLPLLTVMARLRDLGVLTT